MPKGRPMRRKNGSGAIVKLSGKRRQPFEVRVNTHMDMRNYPVYDVLGRFSSRDDAELALSEYRKQPYDINLTKLSFSQVYEMWFDKKYNKSKKKYSTSSIYCTQGAYKKAAALHDMLFQDIRTIHMQTILDDHSLSHAYMEHIQNLFKQMYRYALEYDIATKDYSRFTQITKEDDDEHGVPFTQADISALWNHQEHACCRMVLIMIYSGWRIGELQNIKLTNIDLQNQTFCGGNKTAAGKNRIVPIHSKIAPFITPLSKKHKSYLFEKEGARISKKELYDRFSNAMTICGLKTKHTPHDCRHTCATLLDNAGANPVSIKKILGHSIGNDVTQKVYTHKDIEELRKAIEMI